MLDKILSFIADRMAKQDYHVQYSDTGKTVTVGTALTFREITLPANGKYLIVSRGGGGATSGTLNQYLMALNGTAFGSNYPRQIMPVAGGAPGSLVAYVEVGSSPATISIQGSAYGSSGAKFTSAWHTTDVIGIG